MNKFYDCKKEDRLRKGYEIDLKCLGDLEINPLIASDSNERYIHHGIERIYRVTGPKDDMELVYSSLEKMNVLVFGTPIYFDHVSARAKIFIDRLIYCYNKNTRPRFPGNVEAVVIITYEENDPELYDGVVEWIRGRFEDYWKIKVVATLKAENTVKNPVFKRDGILKKARQIGRNL